MYMKHTPFRNALFALGYIILLVSSIYSTSYVTGAPEESVLYPMVMLSLLVLSVALMAYLFFYQPMVLILDGEREKAVSFFIRMLSMFALGIVVILGAVLIVSL